MTINFGYNLVELIVDKATYRNKFDHHNDRLVNIRRHHATGDTITKRSRH